MRIALLTISALMVSLSLPAQPLRIASFDRNGNLLATNTSVQQRYSLGWSASVEGLAPINMTTLQSRVAHSASTAFRSTLEHPRMFFRVLLDPFATSDLAGLWTSHELVTSASGPTDFVGWIRFEWAFNAQGTGSVTAAQRSNGDTNIYFPTIPLTVASDGTGGGLTPPPVMALDKNTIFGVRNDGRAGYSLFTMVRRAASGFATTDLQGQWTMFLLVSPDDPTDFAGWVRLELTFNSQGNGTVTTVQRSNGDTNWGNSTIPLTVASNGTVIGLSPSPVMTLDKNAISGVTNDGGGGKGFFVMVKRAASGFSTADAEGRWTMFMLVTRYGPPAFAGWGRHETTIDAQGHGAFTAAQRSNGDTSLPSPFSLAVATDGTMSGLTPPPVMALDKNTMCGVMTEQTGGFNFYVLVRR